MHDLLWFLNILRRVEALLLPLFPGRWRTPPPSYRLVQPILSWLQGRRESRKWTDPLLETIRSKWYKPYHEAGLSACGLAPGQLRWMRWVSGLAAILVLLGLTPWGASVSLGVRTSLLLGAAALLVCASVRLHYPWAWAIWGLLFQPVVFLSVGMAWAGLAVSAAVAIWHIGPARKTCSWRTLDPLFALPILSSWWMVTRSWLPEWSYWQSGALLLVLFSLVWAWIARTPQGTALSLAAKLLWPSSLTAVMVVSASSSWLKLRGIPEPAYWVLWAAVALMISFILALSGTVLTRMRWLHSSSAVMAVFGAYALVLILFKPREGLARVLGTEIQQLYQWLWPLWWMAGGGVVFYSRKIALLILQWVQILSGRWVLPIGGTVLAAIAWPLGWYGYVELGLGRMTLAVLLALYLLGIAVLAINGSERATREWTFHSLLIFGLIDQYYVQLHSTVASMEDRPILGACGFALVSIWLLWLAFDLAGRDVRRFVQENDPAKVQIVGGFLWLLLATLWFSYVNPSQSADTDFSLKGNVTFDMFVGLTMLGLPMAGVDVLTRIKGEPSTGFPWLRIVAAGVMPVQFLQGIEHYVSARIEGVSGDMLHRTLAQATPSDAARLALTPACALVPAWVLGWTLGRWLLVMALATWLARRLASAGAPRWVRPTAICCVSLAAGTAEKLVLPWPAMPYDWSVILRPWVRHSMIWDLAFLKFYAVYACAGWLWGWFVAERFCRGIQPLPERRERLS